LTIRTTQLPAVPALKGPNWWSGCVSPPDLPGNHDGFFIRRRQAKLHLRDGSVVIASITFFRTNTSSLSVMIAGRSCRSQGLRALA
jgi:hypothetical protein